MYGARLNQSRGPCRWAYFPWGVRRGACAVGRVCGHAGRGAVYEFRITHGYRGARRDRNFSLDGVRGRCIIGALAAVAG
jgi:hypothetical protein